MTNPTDHRQLVRDALGKADPGLLKLLDAAKGKFNVRLTGYAVDTPEGWVGHGALKQQAPKERTP